MGATAEKVQENGKANGAREVGTICGFCGVGCGLILKVEDGVIQKVTGEKENPSSKGEACIKGREGWRHLYSEKRLTTPSSARTASWSRPRGTRPSTSWRAR
jgi:anaerobic selenocysteine-containing dehydrogenase